MEFSIDGLEEKPWRKPGADITDYFNYGFTEDTWRAYTDRQKRMRFESGGPQIINPVGPKVKYYNDNKIRFNLLMLNFVILNNIMLIIASGLSRSDFCSRKF